MLLRDFWFLNVSLTFSSALLALRAIRKVFPSYIWKFPFNSQNHRIVRFGRDLWRSYCPALLLRQGHLQEVAGAPPAAFGRSAEKKTTTSSGSLLQCSRAGIRTISTAAQLILVPQWKAFFSLLEFWPDETQTDALEAGFSLGARRGNCCAACAWHHREAAPHTAGAAPGPGSALDFKPQRFFTWVL